jgi:hypothetical protein
MDATTLTAADLERRIVWQESPHLDHYGTLKGYTPGGHLVIKLERPLKRRGQGAVNTIQAPAIDCRFVEPGPIQPKAQGVSDARNQ